MPLTTPLFWDCECEHNYIHSKADKQQCRLCHTIDTLQPDSRVDEVAALYQPRYTHIAQVPKELRTAEYLVYHLDWSEDWYNQNILLTAVLMVRAAKGGWFYSSQYPSGSCDWRYPDPEHPNYSVGVINVKPENAEISR